MSFAGTSRKFDSQTYIGKFSRASSGVARSKPMSTRLIVLLIVGLGAAGAAAQAREPVETVASVDLNRYMGEWHEIARFPNRFQRQCAGDVRATYTLRSDGRVDVLNQCRTAEGETSSARGLARVVDSRTRARLEVRFAPAFLSWLPLVWGDYWVIGLADDYGWAVVGSPNREYLWILSRTPSLEDAQYEQALGRAKANGFDVSRLERTDRGPTGLLRTRESGPITGLPDRVARRSRSGRTAGIPASHLL
jgi:apolipoprotein D and lipocalin family protein